MPSSELIPFVFDGRTVRVVEDEEGNPWFVAKDVALALGYHWNGQDCIAHVPGEWRWVRSVLTHRRGEQETWLLSEQGLYFFLGRSDKTAALPFQKWLAGEVLPALRRTGRYRMEQPEELPALPEASPVSVWGQDEDEQRRAAAALSPRYRERALGYAVQMARSQYDGDVQRFFLMFCSCIAGPGASGADDGPARAEAWAREHLEAAPGASGIQSKKVYAAYLQWHRRERADAEPLSGIALGRILKRLFPWYRSNLFYYRVRWRRAAA